MRYDGSTRNYDYQLGKSGDNSDLFNLKGLDYNGSFGRGINFGNNQSLVVNSNFDLQMAGKLSNDIEILAAISDSNLPIQADGNTQQLQEFDKIFIQLKKQQHTLLMGDYEIFRPKSYFLNFNRKLQGAKFSTGTKLGNGELKGAVNGAIAKGNYNRMVFDGIEGNQGPYRLQGANGELFLIVLSGMEKVFIDGKQLERGADNDYVMDYNLAEITFTPRQIITKDKRITIEFEYIDRNYLRSLLYTTAEYKTDKLTINAHVFTEQDAKNQPLLNEEEGDDFSLQRAIFAEVGDDIEEAVLTDFAPVGNIEGRVRYVRIDSTVAGITYPDVYVFAAKPPSDVDLYAPIFRLVGQGRGSYVLEDGIQNGRVYSWIAPDENGNLQGNYALGTLLVTPKKRQLTTLGADYKLSENSRVFGEVALSKNDLNTFSDIGDADDGGQAAMLGFENVWHLNKEKNSQLATSLKYEVRESQFVPLEPYRPIEFTRDWNLQGLEDSENENIGSLELAWKQGSQSLVQYRLGSFLRGNQTYKGLKQVLNGFYRPKGWDVRWNVSYLTTENDTTLATQFLRPNVQVSKLLKGLKWGVGFEQEQNRRTELLTDNLQSSSFYYNEASVFVSTPDTSKNQMTLRFRRRWDYSPQQKDFTVATVGDMLSFNGERGKTANSRLSWNLTYRSLQIEDVGASDNTPKTTVLGDIRYNFKVLKGAVRSSSRYLAGSGQEEKVQLGYQFSPSRNGNFVWRDANEDGIATVDEYQIGNPDLLATEDSTYFEVALPTGQFELTNRVGFNQTFNLNFKTLWREKGGFLKGLSRFSLQSRIDINRETKATSFDANHYNPLWVDFADSLIVSERVSNNHTLFFNRNSPDFEARIFRQKGARRQLLLLGFDENQQTEYGSELKHNFSRNVAAELKGSVGEKGRSSSAYEEQNYRIGFWKVSPSVSIQSQRKFRIKAAYQYQFGKNELIDTSQAAVTNELKLQGQYGQPSKGLVRFDVSWVNIDYQVANFNSPVAYNLLNGLQPNGNFIWRTTYTTRLKGNIQLELRYEGRKSGESRTVHKGGATMRALF